MRKFVLLAVCKWLFATVLNGGLLMVSNLGARKRLKYAIKWRGSNLI